MAEEPSPSVPPSRPGRRSASQRERRRGWLVPFAAVLGAVVCGLLPVVVSMLPTAAARTVADRLEDFGDSARARLEPYYAKAGVRWPGRRGALLGIKDEAALELHVMDESGAWHALRRYPVLAASGRSGPKLREGDFQVPEGLYRVSFLNANSRFHVSLRLDYPNAFDRDRAREDGRRQLGGDIMIHGGRASIGCLAMGDPVAEELFTLAADLGMQQIEVILMPSDFRHHAPPDTTEPAWLASLYRSLAASAARFEVVR